MDEHVHGPLINRYPVRLLGGPFDGMVLTASGCCTPPWLIFVSHTPQGPQAWHPEEAAPDIYDVEQYLRDVHLSRGGIAAANHLPPLQQIIRTA